MNNTFDIKRFGNVVRRDGMSYFKNFGWTLVVLWSIPVIFWIMTYVSDGVYTNRDILISLLMWLSLIIVPSRLYKDVNGSRKGMLYAMTPASSLEKFLSMLLYCVLVTPIVYMLGAIAVDTILALKPGTNPYDGFIFGDYEGLRPYDIVKLGSGEMNLVMNNYLDTKRLFVYHCHCVLILSVSSVFMFANMLFKKRKLSKTIGILTLIGIIFSILMVRLVTNIDLTYLDDYTESEMVDYLKLIIDNFYAITFISGLTISLIFFYLTYHRIKKQTY